MASTVSLVALALFASSQVAVVALTFVLGLSAFFTAPALNARISVAGAAPHPGRCDDHGRVQLGSTSGPWLGGTVIDADFGFAAWAGASMTVLVLVAVFFSLRLHRGRGVPSRLSPRQSRRRM